MHEIYFTAHFSPGKINFGRSWGVIIIINSSLNFKYHPELDGVRAIAIAGVIGLHLRNKLILGGDQGVTLFFVLSGFLITTILIQEFTEKGNIDVTAFYARRITRLVPALFVALFANIIFYGPEIGWSKIALYTLPALFYFSNFFRAANIYLPGLGYTWSLSVEGQFYLLWPWLVRKFLNRSLFKLIIACLIVLVAIEIVRIEYIHSTKNWFLQVYYSTWSRGGAILFGTFAAIWLTRPNRKKLPLAPIWSVAGLLTIILLYGFGNYTQPTDYTVGLALTCIAGVCLILGLCESSKGPVAWLLRQPPVVHIGRLSYSVYLWNTLTLESWRNIHSNALPRGIIGTLFWLLATFAIAELSYRLVELPIQRWARPLIKRRSEEKKSIQKLNLLIQPPQGP